MNPSSSEPNPHLEFHLPPLAPSLEEPPTPEPDPPALKKRNRWIGVALFGIVAALVAIGAQRREDAEEVALAKRYTQIIQALDKTKSNLVRKSAPESVLVLRKNQRTMYLSEGTQAALKAWKVLANAPDARPSDFRRYALALSALDSPQNANIPIILSRLTNYKAPPLSSKASSKAILKEYQQYIHPIPIERERELWEAIYSQKPLDKRLLPDYLARVDALRLGWFTAIAKHDLYSRAGRMQEAQEEMSHALLSGAVLTWTSAIESYLLVAGLVAWIFLIVRSVITRTSPAFALLRQKAHGETLEFGYHPRVFVFVTYLVLPFAMLLLSPIISALFKGSSALTYARGYTIFYLVESAATLIFCVWLLRRRSLEAGLCTPTPMREAFAKLGWRSPKGAFWLGVRSYALLLLPLLMVTAFSQNLFRHFQTPSHPIVLSMALMNKPFDWLLLLLEAAVLAPIVEETLFRGILYPALRSKMGVMGGIVMTSTIFAILHPTLPAGFLPLFLMGAVMAYLYEVKGSLLPGMILHALINGFIMLLQLSALAN